MRKPFQVLGNVDIPIQLLNYRFELLHDLNSTLPAGFTYTSPPENRERIFGGSPNWHKDGSGKPAALIVWTNVYPTEVLLPDGRAVSGEPNDVVLIDNHLAKHRTPEEYVRDVRRGPTKARHFLRYWLHTYPTDEQILLWSQEIRDKQLWWNETPKLYAK